MNPTTVTPCASRRVPPKLKERFSEKATKKNAKAATREKELSLETLRALEKHYRNGIGIRLGPSLEMSAMAYTTPGFKDRLWRWHRRRFYPVALVQY